LAGRPPDNLAGKYGIAESMVRHWRLFCKRCLDLEVGYGVKAFTFLDKKEDPRPMDGDV
jgi:hypothetical protein